MANIYALHSGYPVHTSLLYSPTILHNYTSLASCDLAIVPSHNSIKHTVIQVLFPGVPVYIQALRFTPLRQDKAVIHTPYSVLVQVLRTPYSDRVQSIGRKRTKTSTAEPTKKKKKRAHLAAPFLPENSNIISKPTLRLVVIGKEELWKHEKFCSPAISTGPMLYQYKHRQYRILQVDLYQDDES